MANYIQGMNMESEPKFKIVNTYFPNGKKYTSQIYEQGILVRVKKYFITGELESLCEYENGQIINKKIFSKNQRIRVFISYFYDNNNNVYKITKDEEYVSSQVIFHHTGSNNEISEIIVKVNNDVSRRVNFEYEPDFITCFDSACKTVDNYKLRRPPIADDSWLNDSCPESLVMRKLKIAKALIA